MNSNVKIDNRSILGYATATWLAGVLVVSNAFADVPTETVKFQDLNVSTPAGVAALYSRIHWAAKRVCAPPAGWGEQVRANACARNAEAKAIEKLNLPALTAYYQKKTGSPPRAVIANR
jgi:UrcA family protein